MMAATMPATARIWLGTTAPCHSGPKSHGISTGAVDDQHREQRQHRCRVQAGGALVQAAQLVAVRRARVEREGDPEHDPADLLLVGHAELERAPVQPGAGGREAGGEDHVVGVREADVHQPREGGRDPEARDVADGVAAPEQARPERRGDEQQEGGDGRRRERARR